MAGIDSDISCGGASATLTASGGISYVWDDMSSANPRTVTLEGTYYVTVTDANGCTDTDSEVISGLGMPPINIGGDCYETIDAAVGAAYGNGQMDIIHINFGTYSPMSNVTLESGDIIIIHDGVSLNILSGITFCNEGGIQLQGTAMFINSGIYTGTGIFEGNFVNNGGTLVPGSCD
jgi:pectin methylesterase-like acyl-CoA thioesterase